MKYLLFYLCIQSIESFHSINSIDLSCRKHQYELIINPFIISDSSSISLQTAIGLNSEYKSSFLTNLWSKESQQQILTLRSHSSTADEIVGENNNLSWKFDLNQTFNSKFQLTIQSTLFTKQIDLIIHSNKTLSSSLQSEHTRSDLLVTNYGIVFPKDWHCLYFPLLKRFSSTFTNGMNMEQIPDENDLLFVQHDYGQIQQFFYYSIYPFIEWKRQSFDFEFFDVLFIPFRQLAIFQLNTSSDLILRIYKYELHNQSFQLKNDDPPIETNISSSTYFHMYFHMLSNLFYLIGNDQIYASNDYGEKFVRIWTNDLGIDKFILHNPIVFPPTGHLAFVYQLNESFRYFAVVSKAGLYYTWRTRIFRSSTSIVKPFFFDSTGSLYFNTTPPLLIILATEQSLIATSNLVENVISHRLFVHETDLISSFVFCSITKWNDNFDLIGSTLRFDQLGLYFVIKQYSSLTFPFCLQTTRLSDERLKITKNCSLILHSSQIKNQIELEIHECSFHTTDQYSTVISSNFPNIFIETIRNQSFAYGRIFEEKIFKKFEILQWNLFSFSKIEQVFDRCLLTHIDVHHHYRSTFITLPPTINYSLIHGDALITKKFIFLIENDYTFNGNNLFITTSFFHNTKSFIQQEFLRSQFSCYLPIIRTIIFQTKCLNNMFIEPRFEINENPLNLTAIEPPINFQLNRYRAGFHSVLVYNLDDKQLNICDSYRNCSCLSSILSHDESLHCAQQFYTLDSTVNNHIQLKLYLKKEKSYLVNNESIFLLEELANRTDYELMNNQWSEEIRRKYLNLFTNHSKRLTDIEKKIYRIIQNEKQLFLGPNLRLRFHDEGLFHFRLTYLWGDQFCLTSLDLPILLISNTPTIASYLFRYFLACIFILVLILILWLIYVYFSNKFIRQMKTTKHFFKQRTIIENQNFDILIQIREQSNQLLPYQQMIRKENEKIFLEKQHLKQLVNQITNLS